MKQIPMLDLKLEYDYMKDAIDSAIRRCLDHQKWIFGPEVKELEDAVARYLGVSNCIGVSSGTEALLLSLRALAIRKTGREYFEKADEIITTPFTFTATGDAILRAGATPVFVDIDPATYNIDAGRIREYLRENPGTVKGIIPVHLYGQACSMDEIMNIAQEHGLFVVEDIAQAFGGSWKERKLGAIGTTGCFSFFPSKNLGGFGDGGMVSTNDSDLASLIRMLLKHGGRDKYNVDHIGYNARLDTLQAAVVLAKFAYIDEFNRRRQEVAKRYTEGMKGIGHVTLPAAAAHHVYHQYTIRSAKRDGLQTFLKDRGIASMVYYPFPLHKMKVFDGRMKTPRSLPHAESAALQVLSLPVAPLQSVEDTQRVINAVREFAG